MVAVAEAILRTEKLLQDQGIPDARLEAELFLTHVLDAPRHLLYAYPERELDLNPRRTLARLVERRLAREPLAYILGRKEFYGIDLCVGPAVLIPRPETELLVQQAASVASKHSEVGEPVIVEAGTGCGAIAISLAIHLPPARIYATDVSSEALEIAQENAAMHSVADRITFLEGDLLEPVEEMADIIVANLPYLPSGRIHELQPEIQWEPRIALDGGPDGLDLLKRLLHQAQHKLKGSGVILMELDPQQVGPMADAVQVLFPGASISVEQDLSHQDRVLIVC